MAVAALAVSGGLAEAQARSGRYGGGLVEFLLTSGRTDAREAAMAQPRGRVDAYGYADARRAAVSAADPMMQSRQEPAAASAYRRGNPYEDASPITYAPESAAQPEPMSTRQAMLFSNRADPRYQRPAPAVAPIARAIDPRYARQMVAFEGHQRPGTIVIDTGARMLYLVQDGGKAMRYGIGVAREGFLWHGVKTISAKKEWPDWYPPKEMLARRPDLPTFMAGGPENPLGARAMYLGSSLYRIHGTNEPHTIGQAVSSGCIRMMNEDVIDLYERTNVGARVEVI